MTRIGDRRADGRAVQRPWRIRCRVLDRRPPRSRHPDVLPSAHDGAEEVRAPRSAAFRPLQPPGEGLEAAAGRRLPRSVRRQRLHRGRQDRHPVPDGDLLGHEACPAALGALPRPAQHPPDPGAGRGRHGFAVGAGRIGDEHRHRSPVGRARGPRHALREVRRSHDAQRRPRSRRALRPRDAPALAALRIRRRAAVATV